jgi:tetratricopeptide (TPR) repeat protein
MAYKAVTLKALKAQDEAQVPPRLGLRIVLVFVALQLALMAAVAFLFPGKADAQTAQPIKGELSVSTAGGYARFIFALPEEVETDVRLANGILVISFKKPVDVSVDKVSMQAAGYVSAARRDPDGAAVRMALGRKVTVNTMAAGEKFFVDLLPETWTGLPPGLPQDVVDDLARRAREAEKAARAQQQAKKQRTLPPVRVRVGTQPTFTRYTFALPALISVQTERQDSKLNLTFEAPLRFDLSDVQAALPPIISSVDSKPGEDATQVNFDFVGKVDVRTFRDENNFVLDVQPLRARAEGASDPAANVAATAARLRQQAPHEGAAAEKPAAPPVAAAARPAETAKPAEGAKPAAAAKPPEPAKPVEIAKPSEVPKPPDVKPAEKPAQTAAAPAETPAKPADTPAGIVASKEPAQTAAAPPAVTPPATIPARESAAPAAPVSQAAAASAPSPAAALPVEVRRQGDAVRLTFPFSAPTPAAVFRRGDMIWLVFDSQTPIDVSKLVAQAGRTIRSAAVTRSNDGQVVQLKLEQPKLTSAGADGAAWTVVIGDAVLEPTQPLSITRNLGTRTSASIPFNEPKQLHRLIDPEVGDTLLVVTALGPARGFLKTQELVEFNALLSTHGIVVQPLADDVNAEVAPDRVMITRPGGLTLSSPSARALVATQSRDGGRRGATMATIDPQAWGFDRESDFRERQSHLIAAAAAASDAQRTPAQLDLARFYLARELIAEAKGVLDVAVSDEKNTHDTTPLVLRAIANIMLGRATDALKDLGNGNVAKRGDVGLWRALALTQLGKWAEAREGFRSLEAMSAALPLELQRYAFQEAARAAVEVRDYNAAANLINEFDTLGPVGARGAELAILKGRVMEGLGRNSDALTLYRGAAELDDRHASARGLLREVALRQVMGDIRKEEATSALESLTTSWRGDETEAEALQLLGRFYAEEGRYRDAFQVMRTALTVHPHSEMTRRIHDEAAGAFDSLFLGGKGDNMPAIDALSLFYDFRDLTPVGRRGDEMIRKLADRLVGVDLLDQAAELLQHQVDNRLQGAARAQVATRLAIIYLIARKPERAITVLRNTRTADLPNEMRNQRMLIEARANSDVGRPDAALEMIANLNGPEVERLRADILWKSRRWRDAGEQLEKMYAERWRDFTPLTEPERGDIMRAAIAYALGEDMIGLDRFRNKYMPKMAEGPDRRAFEVVTAPFNANAPEFGDIARVVAATDTLQGFLRDIRARYPDQNGPSAAPAPAPPAAPSRGAAVAGDPAG